jgi:hypothetical protein
LTKTTTTTTLKTYMNGIPRRPAPTLATGITAHGPNEGRRRSLRGNSTKLLIIAFFIYITSREAKPSPAQPVSLASKSSGDEFGHDNGILTVISQERLGAKQFQPQNRIDLHKINSFEISCENVFKWVVLRVSPLKSDFTSQFEFTISVHHMGSRFQSPQS